MTAVKLRKKLVLKQIDSGNRAWSRANVRYIKHGNKVITIVTLKVILPTVAENATLTLNRDSDANIQLVKFVKAQVAKVNHRNIQV